MISYVAKASAASTSVALPGGIQVGDLIVIVAYRNSLTAPTLPAGYTSVFSQSANSNAHRVGYKFATGGDTSGTWTGATVVTATVYRGVGSVGAVAGATNASAASTTISAITLNNTDGNSWVMCWAGSLQTTSMGTPTGLPSDAVIRSTQVGTSAMAISADSNAGVSTWGAHTSANGTNAIGSGGSLELIPDTIPWLVQSAQGSGSGAGSAAATLSASSTTGHSIVVIVGMQSGSVSSVTDGLGNTYTQRASNAKLAVYVAENITGGATTVTVNFSSSVNSAIIVRQYGGVSKTGAFDKAANATATSTSLSSGATATTTQAIELVIGAGANSNGQAMTVGSGYGNFLNNNSVSSVSVAAQDKIVYTTGTQTSTMSMSLSQAWGAAVVTLMANTPVSVANGNFLALF